MGTKENKNKTHNVAQQIRDLKVYFIVHNFEHGGGNI